MRSRGWFNLLKTKDDWVCVFELEDILMRLDIGELLWDGLP